MAHQIRRRGTPDLEAGLAEGVDDLGIQLCEQLGFAATYMLNIDQKCEEQQESRMNSKVHDAIWIPTLAYHEKRRCDMLSSHALEVATVTVDDRCETVFGIPLKWLTRTSKLFATWYAGRGEEKYILAGNPSRLGSVPSQIFCDFARWLHRNRIADPWCVEAPYLVEATARRLVDALDLGIFLDSAEYQLAAMREFLALAPFLEWPEDYVNSIWSVTTNLRNSEAFHHLDNFEKIRLMHPMRQMIVAIVAAKTVGKGKRSVRTGPRDLGVDRGDEITGHIFWVKYNEYRKQQNAEGDDYECAMPERVEWFL